MAPKTKRDLQVERNRFKAEVQKLLEEYDKDGNKSLDKGEVTQLLTALDGGSPPLGKDVAWVMKMGDKDNSGSIASGELFVVLQKFRKYREDFPSLLKLIEKHDKDKNGILADEEMKTLLAECYDRRIEDEDVDFVQAQFKELSADCGSANVKENMASLSKAISLWEAREIEEDAGFLSFIPAFSMPKMEPPDISGATENVSKWGKQAVGVFTCCGETRKEKDDKSGGQYV